MALIIDPETISKAFKLKTSVNSGYTFLPINPTELKKSHEFIVPCLKIQMMPCNLLPPTLRICLGFGLGITLI